MGLFEKKFCDLCNEKVNMLTRLKLSDGFLCSDCKKKLSCLSGSWGERSVSDVKAHLEARENNRQKYAQFHMSAGAGVRDKIMVDMSNGKFCFNIGRDYSENNPEVFDFSQLMDFYLKESYTDERDSDDDGIPDRVDTFDNRTGQAVQPKGNGAMFGGVMNSMGMMNPMGMQGAMGMNASTVSVAQYMRNTDRSVDYDGNPRRVSSVDAYIVVNHPYINEIKLNVAYIPENAAPTQLMQAYNDALAIMELCRQIKNPNASGGFANQNPYAGGYNQQPVQQCGYNQQPVQQGGYNQQPVQQGGYNQQPVQQGGFGNQNTQQSYNQQSVPQNSAAVMPFCPSCGAQNTAMSAFCPNCGTPLKK